jgi:surface antigen
MVMSNLPRFAAGVLLSLSLVGCANADLGPKQTVGTLLGAGTGALLGAQFGHGTGQLVATSVGTLLGAYLGNEAGKSLDRADALYASRAEYQALEYTPSGSATPWRNPDSGHYGRVTRSRRTRARTARTAASSSTRRRSAGARATSMAPHAAPPTANGRW